MKIAIIGTGRMGSLIAELAIKSGHQIVAKINENSLDLFESHEFKSADVAIEFTQPTAVVSNLYKCLDANVPVVCGTTGWHDQVEEVTNKFKSQNGALLYASNFSVGVNLFFEMNRILASWMEKQPSFQASMKEIHHLQKLDKPSGTAVTLAKGIIDEHSEYQKWSLLEEYKSNSKELPIEALRAEHVIGEHEVVWKSMKS
jgi:4-hydroxy-tetrahydrodipicolinate reductase